MPKRPEKWIAVDTETTGFDSYHGCRPYFVTLCDQDQNQLFWEWDVCPITRMPFVPFDDLFDIREEIHSADRVVFINSKFDMKMLASLSGSDYPNLPEMNWDWPWDKIHDVSVSSHMLGSSQLKDLTTLALRFCRINLEPFETAVLKATQKAQRLCRSKKFKEEVGVWNIARDDHPMMPSGGGSKADMWLLRAMIKHAPQFLPDWEYWDGGWWYAEKIKRKEVVPGDNPEDHPWKDLCEIYANPDSAATIEVHIEQMKRIEAQGLMSIYERRRKLLQRVYEIESYGVTVKKSHREELMREFGDVAEKSLKRCLALSEGKLESLPLQGVSNALKEVVFNDFGLSSPKKTAKGNPSMDKDVLDTWLFELPPKSKAAVFIKSLKDYRKRMTAINYMNSYERFWVSTNWEDIALLHPGLNMTGTATLRWSSSNPNEQNISKQEGFNLRYMFGPPPGYIWASYDYENLELRIPAYESGEEALIELFERADDPPFYGSNHLLNFSVIYPDIWDPVFKEVGPEKVAGEIKKRYKSTWYQRCKNGNFAVQYGAIEREGEISTADKAYGREGCHRMLKQKFAKLTALNEKCIKEAEETGYVHTIPDNRINPDRGYPLECSRTKYGRVKPTVPLNYHIQGTACWVIGEAMLEVCDYLDHVNRSLPSNLKAGIVMQVHDEINLAIPIVPKKDEILRTVHSIMESIGDRISVPLKVGCDIHEDNWAEGVPYK